MIRSTRLGLAAGIMWGASLFIMTILSINTGYAKTFLMVLQSIYIGFDVSWGGAFLGLLYGFLDGFVALFIIGWLYSAFGGCIVEKRKTKRRRR